jgi:hypothetical protein
MYKMFNIYYGMLFGTFLITGYYNHTKKIAEELNKFDDETIFLI